jgi:hypothetical protein
MADTRFTLIPPGEPKNENRRKTGLKKKQSQAIQKNLCGWSLLFFNHLCQSGRWLTAEMLVAAG